MFRKIAIALSICLVTAIPRNAMADLVFNFTGSVIGVDAELASQFTVGESVVGSYTFNEAAVDEAPGDMTLGIYDLATLTVTFGGDYTVTQGSDSEIQVLDGPPGNDVYAVLLDDPSGPTVAGLSVTAFVFGPIDVDSAVFNSDALPIMPPNLSAFESLEDNVLLFSDGADTNAGVEFRLTSITAVPEGSACLGIGLIALTMLGRAWWRMRRNKCPRADPGRFPADLTPSLPR
jgi:hypothetical protein